jgi:hypothetical protein
MIEYVCDQCKIHHSSLGTMMGCCQVDSRSNFLRGKYNQNGMTRIAPRYDSTLNLGDNQDIQCSKCKSFSCEHVNNGYTPIRRHVYNAPMHGPFRFSSSTNFYDWYVPEHSSSKFDKSLSEDLLVDINRITENMLDRKPQLVINMLDGRQVTNVNTYVKMCKILAKPNRTHSTFYRKVLKDMS